MTISYGSSIITDNLVMLLDAANPRSYPRSGSTWNDISGSANTGTLQSTPTYNAINGGYFIFNGTSNYVSTATLISSPTNFSLGIWFQTSIAAGHKLIGFENTQTTSPSTAYDRHLYIGPDGLLNFGIYNSGYFLATSSTAVNDGKWHYAVGAYNNTSGNMSLYIDSVLVGTSKTNLPGVYTGYWRIASYTLSEGAPGPAGWPNGVDGYFNGNISVAQVYYLELTANQVSQNFEAYRGRYGI